jgi:peptide-methionine (S)-S-oxide reductase
MAREIATLGGGCFWCLEAAFQQLAGVHAVTSGYCGGTVEHPTYQQVCNGATGHAEVVRVEFDPAVIDYRGLLGVFFAIHDPTTPTARGTTSAASTARRSSPIPPNRKPPPAR